MADTATSRVYKVVCADVRPSVLKILKPYDADKMCGVGQLEYYADDGAVEIFARSDMHILTDWMADGMAG